jgi:hypothetical protein
MRRGSDIAARLLDFAITVVRLAATLAPASWRPSSARRCGRLGRAADRRRVPEHRRLPVAGRRSPVSFPATSPEALRMTSVPNRPAIAACCRHLDQLITMRRTRGSRHS